MKRESGVFDRRPYLDFGVLEQTEPMLGSVIAFSELANRPPVNVLKKLRFQRTGELSFEGMTVVLFGRASIHN